MRLTNLATGATSKDLEEVYEASEALFLAVNFLGWSPDGKRIAMMMTKRNMRDDRSVSSDYDLTSVDPATLKAEYVATIHREGWDGDTWYGNRSIWKEKDGAFELAVDPSFKNDPALTHKRN
jgi:hypothetical protein